MRTAGTFLESPCGADLLVDRLWNAVGQKWGKDEDRGLS
jgi:hypothetical protein